MSLRIFVPQSTIDTWVATDQVDLAGDVITIRPRGIRLKLAPASYFMSVAGGAVDNYNLIGRVKDQEAISALGGEAYMTSVVISDAAYDVEPGFIALPVEESADGGRALLEALSHMQH